MQHDSESAPTREPSGDGGRIPVARPTWAEVDLSALAHNLRELRSIARPAQVYAVVKADAYGHGLRRVALWLEQHGADGLCVALAEEGLRLREAGVRLPVLVLNGAYGTDHRRVLDAGLTPVVYSIAHALAFARARPGQRVPVHVKVDTGMARLGVVPAELPALIETLAAHPNLRVEGVMTHLASADDDADATREQLAVFERAIAQLRAAGHEPRFVHAANSAATLAFPQARHSLVRVGLAMYGVSPRADVGQTLRPAMRVRSEILALRELPVGAPVGYNHTFRTARQSRIATVPIGYGDGLMRAASNRGSMLVGGRTCPIVGRISMDLTTLDVTDVPGCAVGDEVVVLGRQGNAELRADDLARAAGTISYEVLTSISARVPRVYV